MMMILFPPTTLAPLLLPIKQKDKMFLVLSSLVHLYRAKKEHTLLTVKASLFQVESPIVIGH